VGLRGPFCLYAGIALIAVVLPTLFAKENRPTPSHTAGDHAVQSHVMVLLGLVRDTGMAALIATHNPGLAARMDRTLRLEAGVLVAG